MSTDGESHYLPTLDGWRAVAILGVVATHAIPSHHFSGWSAYGAHGVDLFFAISGLLITTRLLDERARRGSVDLGGFYIRRCFRLLPAAWAYLLAVAVAGAAGAIPWRPRYLLASLGLWRNYLPLMGDLNTAHFWSLNVEEHFYLVWPAVLVSLGTRGSVVAATLGCGAVAWARHDLARRSYQYIDLYGRTECRADALLAGCLMALALASPLRPRIVRALTVPGMAWALLAAYVCVVVVKPPLSGSIGSAILPALIASTMFRPDGNGGRLLESWPMRKIGHVSYSLYLWQQPFLVASAGVEPSWAWQRPPINLIGPFALAWASYRWIEGPARRLGRRLATATR